MYTNKRTHTHLTLTGRVLKLSESVFPTVVRHVSIGDGGRNGEINSVFKVTLGPEMHHRRKGTNKGDPQ